MKWVEMILKFVVDIIHYAAWPSVVIFTLLFFSKPLGELLNRIRKLKHKDSFIDFAALPAEVQKAVGDRMALDATKENLNYDKYLDTIEGLGVVIAIFASRVRKFDKEYPMLDMGDTVLKLIVDKVKADRPTSKFVSMLRTTLKSASPNAEQKQ